MFAIETELGRFAADTERQAKALLRKAQKEHDAAESARKAKRDLALLRATSAGFLILKRMVSGEGMIHRFVKPEQTCGVKTVVHSESRSTIFGETVDGKFSFDLYEHDCVGSLMSPGGWTAAVFLQERSTSGAAYAVMCYAVGTEDTESAWCNVPTALPEMFPS